MWTSGWRWPYTPCLRRKAMNSVSPHSPAWKLLTAASKSSNSCGRMGITGSRVVFELVWVIVWSLRYALPKQKAPLVGGALRRHYPDHLPWRCMPTGAAGSRLLPQQDSPNVPAVTVLCQPDDGPATAWWTGVWDLVSTGFGGEVLGNTTPIGNRPPGRSIKGTTWLPAVKPGY